MRQTLTSIVLSPASRILVKVYLQSHAYELSTLHCQTQEATTLKFSKTPAPNGEEGIVMAEITTGFCLLGTPFGSATFAAEFLDQKLEEVQQHADVITTRVEDLQTRLCLFLHFSI